MTDVRMVRDLMTIGVPTCPVDTPIIDAARLLSNACVEALAVIDREGHAVGVIDQDNLIRAFAYSNWPDLTADAVMSEELVEVPPDIPIAAAAQIMLDRNVRVVYSMHNSEGITYPAAVLSYHHLLRYMAASNDEELADLGIKARRQSPIEAFKEKRDAARRNAPHHHEE